MISAFLVYNESEKTRKSCPQVFSNHSAGSFPVLFQPVTMAVSKKGAAASGINPETNGAVSDLEENNR